MRNCHANNRELPIAMLLAPPSRLTDAELAAFGDDEESAITAAVVSMWRNRRSVGLSMRGAAALCRIKPNVFAQIVTGTRFLPPHKQNVYEEVMGSRAVSQTIERFRLLREQATTDELASAVAEQIRRTA